MNDEYRFPFGQPLLPYQRLDRAHRDVFVLGAYPSALHVAWQAAGGKQRIRALPVDNEPEPFWDGANQDARIADWKQIVGFEDADGSAQPVGGLNGSSGVALDVHYLAPLGIGRDQTWITDCLPIYFASDGVTSAITDRFLKATAGSKRPTPHLPPHPSEAEIVRRATEPAQLEELRAELAASNPSVVITLGNAAARAFRAMLDSDKGPRQLRPEGYGATVDLAPRCQALWYPLAHPGVIRREPWRKTHAEWTKRVRSEAGDHGVVSRD